MSDNGIEEVKERVPSGFDLLGKELATRLEEDQKKIDKNFSDPLAFMSGFDDNFKKGPTPDATIQQKLMERIGTGNQSQVTDSSKLMALRTVVTNPLNRRYTAIKRRNTITDQNKKNISDESYLERKVLKQMFENPSLLLSDSNFDDVKKIKEDQLRKSNDLEDRLKILKEARDNNMGFSEVYREAKATVRDTKKTYTFYGKEITATEFENYKQYTNLTIKKDDVENDIKSKNARLAALSKEISENELRLKKSDKALGTFFNGDKITTGNFGDLAVFDLLKKDYREYLVQFVAEFIKSHDRKDPNFIENLNNMGFNYSELSIEEQRIINREVIRILENLTSISGSKIEFLSGIGFSYDLAIDPSKIDKIYAKTISDVVSRINNGKEISEETKLRLQFFEKIGMTYDKLSPEMQKNNKDLFELLIILAKDNREETRDNFDLVKKLVLSDKENFSELITPSVQRALGQIFEEADYDGNDRFSEIGADILFKKWQNNLLDRSDQSSVTSASSQKRSEMWEEGRSSESEMLEKGRSSEDSNISDLERVEPLKDNDFQQSGSNRFGSSRSLQGIDTSTMSGKFKKSVEGLKREGLKQSGFDSNNLEKAVEGLKQKDLKQSSSDSDRRRLSFVDKFFKKDGEAKKDPSGRGGGR